MEGIKMIVIENTKAKKNSGNASGRKEKKHTTVIRLSRKA